MKGSEIRQKFIEYFERNGHKSVHSSPLLPVNDPTLLFVNAGMNQFKDVFLGNDVRNYTRAVSSQKCIRAGGKHNDLDEVGKTARHHTFFEMLGNFSFGDYFKKDAINFAWDFLTGSVKEGKLGLDPKHLWFTYFEGDEHVPADNEARDLWVKAGANPERVLPFDAKDNFWQMGDTGPCGPCSEIHYYMGDEPDNPEKNRAEFVNAETGDDTIEIWNLVFMQFDKDADGTLSDLPAPSVDTGAGLERLAAVLQGESTNYHTDLIKPIIDFISELSGKEYSYESRTGFTMRVVADHARTTAFAIADCILPGNEGRNYVLRKIMRRAIYHGKEHLGFDGLFFYKVCDFVVEQMQEAFPELNAQREFIGKMVRLEEERFGNTLTVGLSKTRAELTKPETHKFLELMKKISFAKIGDNPAKESLGNLFLHLHDLRNLPKEIEKSVNEEYKKIASEKLEEVFDHLERFKINKDDGKKYAEELAKLFGNLAKLYDTYGTPKDLIRVELEEKGVFLGEEKFDVPFEQQHSKIQIDGGVSQGVAKAGTLLIGGSQHPVTVRVDKQHKKTIFSGYKSTKIERATVIGIYENDNMVDFLAEGRKGLIVLNETPFYAKSGGQVGDKGTLVGMTGMAKGSAEADTSEITNDNVNPPARACGLDKTGGAVKVEVTDTSSFNGIVLHESIVTSGSLEIGDTVIAVVNEKERDATRRNHTATHLVHAALKEVLGTHVKQAGSVVAPEFLRFDFTHYQAISDAELREIEELVNHFILQNDRVETELMSIEDAMRTGAVAMFGEKYGSEVRVLSVGDGSFSKELCGGTHARATGDIGSFKIIAEEAIASGVRRIRAITGFDAFERFRGDEILIDRSLGILKTQREQLPNAIEKLQDELKKTRKERDKLKLKIAAGTIKSSNEEEARDVSGVKVIAKSVDDLDKGGMRHLSDTLMAKIKSGVVIIGNRGNGKVSFIVRVSDDLTAKIKAGNIIREIAPIIGGKGGGRPDMAEGGGSVPEKLSEAIDAGYKVVEKMLG